MTNTGPDHLVCPINIGESVGWLKQFSENLGCKPGTIDEALIEAVEEALTREGKTAEVVRRSVELLDELSF